jgi:hypothetical protein
MNAYELADELHEDLQWIVTSNTDLPSRLVSAINMLRQQADLIRNLQKSLGFKNSGYETINLTPQTKPLTDEEILNEWLGNDRNFYYFARAIEERHGIK